MTAPPPPAPPSVDPPGDAPWPPPSGAPARPPLRRSRTDKMAHGVAGGLAEYSGIDPLLWRVGFVALTFAGGTGILVYLLLCVTMPAGPRPTGDDDAPASAHRSWGRAHVTPALPRSPVGRITLAGVLITAGVLALVARWSDWEPGPRPFLAVALLVVGLGLVAAAFVPGRTARGGLIALGVVLTLALALASSVPWDDAAGVGDRTYRPVSAIEVRDVYSLGVGDLRLDLSAVDVSDLDGPITTRVDSGVGEVHVVVPRDADVRVRADSGIGDVRLFDGGADEGLYPGTGRLPHTDDGEPEIVLVIDSGIGDVEVTRA